MAPDALLLKANVATLRCLLPAAWCNLALKINFVKIMSKVFIVQFVAICTFDIKDNDVKHEGVFLHNNKS